MQKSAKVRTGIAVLALALVAAGSSVVYAATETGTAHVEILTNLTIQEVTQMDFGIIAMPSTGTDSFSLDSAGAVTHTGTDGTHSPGTQVVGTYDLTGEPGRLVDISTTVTTDFAAGVRLTEITLDDQVSNAGTPATTTLDTTGAATARMGGTVEVDAGATTGAHTASIDIVANYQ
ncbi:DUF4402 domain-containing protein [Persicimonas caeni]|nr:DUF4402 domain-containing protein [Persicimonas caeni]